MLGSGLGQRIFEGGGFASHDLVEIEPEIVNQDITALGWSDWHGYRGMRELGSITTRTIDKGLGIFEVDELLSGTLGTKFVEEIKKLGLFFFDQFSDRNERLDVRESVVSVFVDDVIFLGDKFKAVGGLAVGSDGPIDALWA